MFIWNSNVTECSVFYLATLLREDSSLSSFSPNFQGISYFGLVVILKIVEYLLYIMLS